MANSICFYFQVHQPFRLSKINLLNIGSSLDIFEGIGKYSNKQVFQKVNDKCYRPTNSLLHRLISKYPEFKISFSLSGVFLEQAELFDSKLIKSFQKLVATGNVEILSETYYHSLSSLYSQAEFLEQIKQHRRIIWKLFKKKPQIFRNTELIFNNQIGRIISDLGYKAILAEGWDPILNGRSANYPYKLNVSNTEGLTHTISKKFKITNQKKSNFLILTKNYRLSDDVAFRFSDKSWVDYPLNVQKWLEWIKSAEGENVNIFIDYETFGEHQWEDTGIFKFLNKLPHYANKMGIKFKTPSEVIKTIKPIGVLSYPLTTSWADSERDISAWVGNSLQESAIEHLYSFESKFNEYSKFLESEFFDEVIELWRKLQTSDHFYYMSTKNWEDGNVHKYFSPYNSPYDAYINFMNAISNLETILESKLSN
jgi:alpha-amylase